MALAGKVALITGAGRRSGMGWGTAKRLAQDGADIVLTAYGRRPLALSLELGPVTELVDEPRSDADAREEFAGMADELRALGVRVLAASLDVRDKAAAIALVEDVRTKFGRLDILFNNAGVAFGAGPFLDLTDDQWRASLDVNVMGTVNMCQAAIPLMIAGGGGSIINNSSIAGLRALPGLPAYNASKFAVIGLTQSIADEFGANKIRCNAICPGAIHTRLGDLEYAFTAEQMGTGVDQAIAAIVQTIPLGRLGSIEEIAEVVAFFASDASRYITGCAIPVTGGQR